LVHAASPTHIIGKVARLGASGLGPDSGGLTIVIRTDDGEPVEVIANVMAPTGFDGPEAQDHLVEGPIFASYVAIALAALNADRNLICNFTRMDGHNRIDGLILEG
jgi:hypothetical protein